MLRHRKWHSTVAGHVNSVKGDKGEALRMLIWKVLGNCFVAYDSDLKNDNDQFVTITREKELFPYL